MNLILYLCYVVTASNGDECRLRVTVIGRKKRKRIFDFVGLVAVQDFPVIIGYHFPCRLNFIFRIPNFNSLSSIRVKAYTGIVYLLKTCLKNFIPLLNSISGTRTRDLLYPLTKLLKIRSTRST